MVSKKWLLVLPVLAAIGLAGGCQRAKRPAQDRVEVPAVEVRPVEPTSRPVRDEVESRPPEQAAAEGAAKEAAEDERRQREEQTAARAKAEAEARRRADAEAEAKRRADAEAKNKAEVAADLKRLADAEAKAAERKTRWGYDESSGLVLEKGSIAIVPRGHTYYIYGTVVNRTGCTLEGVHIILDLCGPTGVRPDTREAATTDLKDGGKWRFVVECPREVDVQEVRVRKLLGIPKP
jgi:regulator of protease activity HflC (stomatin/prohibitin superfamily)